MCSFGINEEGFYPIPKKNDWFLRVLAAVASHKYSKRRR
jgi:hypothetical protein